MTHIERHSSIKYYYPFLLNTFGLVLIGRHTVVLYWDAKTILFYFFLTVNGSRDVYYNTIPQRDFLFLFSLYKWKLARKEFVSSFYSVWAFFRVLFHHPAN